MPEDFVIPFYGASHPEIFAIERKAMDRDGTVRSWLDSQLPAGLVLDVGAGDGFTAAALSRNDRTVIALEPASGMVNTTRRLCWVRGVAQDLPFHDATFDGVYATWAFFFTNRADLDQGLAEAQRVLRPGGRLLLVDNAGDDGLADLAPRNIASDPDSFKARGFTVDRLTTAFRFDSEAEGRRLLGFWFGEAAAARFSGTQLEHRVFVYSLVP